GADDNPLKRIAKVEVVIDRVGVGLLVGIPAESTEGLPPNTECPILGHGDAVTSGIARIKVLLVDLVWIAEEVVDYDLTLVELLYPLDDLVARGVYDLAMRVDEENGKALARVDDEVADETRDALAGEESVV